MYDELEKTLDYSKNYNFVLFKKPINCEAFLCSLKAKHVILNLANINAPDFGLCSHHVFLFKDEMTKSKSRIFSFDFSENEEDYKIVNISYYDRCYNKKCYYRAEYVCLTIYTHETYVDEQQFCVKHQTKRLEEIKNHIKNEEF